METALAKPRGYHEFRLSTFYFAQFMSVGVVNAFAALWLDAKGLTSTQIGYIFSVPVLVSLVLNQLVGRLADRVDDWRDVIVAGALASAVFPVGLYFVGDFWSILAIWVLANFAQSVIVPVADAAAVRLTRRRGTDFGAVRAWGTVGYLIVILAGGFLVVRFGGEIFLPLFVGLSLLRGLAAMALPKLREGMGSSPTPGATRLLAVMKPWFLLPLAGWAMVSATHLVLNGFQALLWKRQGMSADVIGILIAVGALSEAIMFFFFRKLAGRYSPHGMLMLSAAVSAARWAVMAFEPGVAIVFGLQSLHAVTYALGFLGSVNFTASATSERIAAEAQSFAVVLQRATGMASFVVFGWLVAEWGTKAYLGSAALAAAGGVSVWLALRFAPPRSDDN